MSTTITGLGLRSHVASLPTDLTHLLCELGISLTDRRGADQVEILGLCKVAILTEGADPMEAGNKPDWELAPLALPVVTQHLPRAFEVRTFLGNTAPIDVSTVKALHNHRLRVSLVFCSAVEPVAVEN
jgi:hypothetical protein